MLRESKESDWYLVGIKNTTNILPEPILPVPKASQNTVF